MKLPSAVLLLFPVACLAQTFQGRVTNGSTGNPQPSCQVSLFTSTGEHGRALTNDSGEFRIVPTVKLERHSSAVLHVTQNGVDYFQTVIQGQFVNLKVYQSANQVGLISGQLSILQFQNVGKRLQVIELHALKNASNPPITQVDPDNFVLSIPHGAQIEPAIIAAPDGGTTKVPLVLVAPSPTAGATAAKSVDQYRIDFPIEPGLTKYAVRYDLPYDAREFVFRRLTQYPMDRIGVIVPKSMRFRSLATQTFHPVSGSQNAQEQQVEVDRVAANTAIAFTLSGTGELAHSFRLLQPGEQPAPPVFATNPMTSAIAAHNGIVRANIPLPPPRSLFTGYLRMIALGVLLLVAAQIWFRVLRTKLMNRDGVRSFSTDAKLSYPHEVTEPGRRETPSRHR